MTDSYKAFYAAEEAAKRRERETGIYQIDTYRTKPGIRHLARENGRSMKTLCGHAVTRYWHAPLTSEFYADGTRHVNRCARCFKAKLAE